MIDSDVATAGTGAPAAKPNPTGSQDLSRSDEKNYGEGVAGVQYHRIKRVLCASTTVPLTLTYRKRYIRL